MTGQNFTPFLMSLKMGKKIVETFKLNWIKGSVRLLGIQQAFYYTPRGQPADQKGLCKLTKQS